MAKPESRLQRRMRRALQAEFGGFWYKVWGGPYQPAGIPDLCGVVQPFVDDHNRYRVPGRPVYVEAKMPDGEVSAVQVERVRELADAGAVVCVATTVEGAVECVRSLLLHPERRFCLHCMAVAVVGAVVCTRHETRLFCATCRGQL